MNKKLFLRLIELLILVNSMISVDQWSHFPLGNTTLQWIINFSIIGLILWYKIKEFAPNNSKDYMIVTIYFIWMIAGIIRGMFVPENYWEWKQWIFGTFALSLPLLIYPFSNPLILKKVLSFWIKYGILLFVVFFFWVIPAEAYHFYLGPVILLSCFLPIVPKQWRLLLLILLLLLLLSDFGARSQVIKAAVALTISISFYFFKHVNRNFLKISHWLFYLVPILLLYLGISGNYNLFEALSSNEGKYTQEALRDGEIVEEDLSADTRTFIYMEVINSALVHNYVFWGRTPARGNDSEAFGEFNAEELKTGKYERHCNEVCFPNVFTWLGLFGMILYCLIYLKSSFLAVYKSNSIYMKLIGVFIAFRFAYGWIEDINRFDIANISLWMMIAMGFSEDFRRMNDKEFNGWIRSLFSINIKYESTLDNKYYLS